MTHLSKIKRALLSVSDKTGLADFARQLVAHGVELISTGGTARLLTEHDIPVKDISEFTGFPEIMDGRVKTLHPKVHGGILARRGIDDTTLNEAEIQTIDLVVVNLYPFEQTIAKADCDFSQAIENIDIGGPTMLRAAAKNQAHVGVVVDHADYVTILQEMSSQQGAIGPQLRAYLAQKVFVHTAHYDAAIASYLHRQQNQTDAKQFPEFYAPLWQKQQDLRYGENPHQAAAFYQDSTNTSGSVTNANQLQGKALSFNNLADADTALECVKSFLPACACVIVKHANPCGVAVAETNQQAYQHAFKTDPTSAFGGIIAFNHTVDADVCLTILEQQFVEVIIAPEFTAKALQALQSKPNVRVLACGKISQPQVNSIDIRKIAGGLLLQQQDEYQVVAEELKTVTQRQADEAELADLLFAWKVAKFVKSNAIVYAKNLRTTAIGAGQMSRVYSAKIANIKAADEGLTVTGSVMASDAFFPFRDGIDSAAEVGVTAVIQPGGSIRDKEVIAAADDAGMAMVFTGIRHFRH